jgi:excisionase family DNA binding protein
MTDSALPKIMTIEEVAEYFKINKDVISKELEQGHLRGFKIGTEWRFTDTNLLDFINRNHPSLSLVQSNSPASKYETTEFSETGPFDYQWPKDKEHFENGYETMRTINGRTHTFKIGFTNRQAAGQMRRRVVVWLDNWPVVEFAAGNNYKSDGLLASIIKTQGGRQLRPSAKIPEEYRDFHIGRYDSIVQGPYASRNIAVIVSKDDLESMIRHAVIRATWKDLI